MNFYKITTTSIAALDPRVIIISNLEEEVEIIPQPIVEEKSPQAFESKLVEEVELQQLVNRENGEEFF